MVDFSSNDELVDYLVEQGRIRSESVEDAFRSTDRRVFIPSEHSSYAYTNKPIPIGGVTVSAPHIVAEVTELLELTGDEIILEIGSGSGYQAAILGELAEKVVGIEIDQGLAENSRNKLPENVEIIHGNGFKAVDEAFDRILFSCAAKDFEEALKHTTGEGIIVGPVIENGRQILKKWKDGKTTEHGGVRYIGMQD